MTPAGWAQSRINYHNLQYAARAVWLTTTQGPVHFVDRSSSTKTSNQIADKASLLNGPIS